MNWSDHKITAGKEFDAEIAGHLELAKIILLLISPDFIQDDCAMIGNLER